MSHYRAIDLDLYDDSNPYNDGMPFAPVNGLAINGQLVLSPKGSAVEVSMADDDCIVVRLSLFVRRLRTLTGRPTLDPATPIFDALQDEMSERFWADAIARDFPEADA